MDCGKTGSLIRRLRQEKMLTQRQLGEALGVGDRAVSKWERGLGCPDVSLLPLLSDLLGVQTEKILIGDLNAANTDGGNMKHLKFGVCPLCGNVLTATGPAELFCCGRKIDFLVPSPAEGEHRAQCQEVDGELYLTFAHTMSKAHHLLFVAYVSFDRLYLVRMYPEQEAALRLPPVRKGILYMGCSQHGLFEQRL